MAETLNVPEARRQIMRWQQNLRFGKTEEERKLKAANLKVVDADESQGLKLFLRCLYANYCA